MTDAGPDGAVRATGPRSPHGDRHEDLLHRVEDAIEEALDDVIEPIERRVLGHDDAHELPVPEPRTPAAGVDHRVPGSLSLRLRWWKETVYIGVFYAVYTAIRNTQGSERVGELHAFNNAKRLIRLERWIGLYHEESIQEFFLRFRWLIRSMNVYYGSLHFIVTIAALVWCYRAMPGRYPRIRNTLMWTTGLALIGFFSFPLMPPRLMPESYGFVDTLADIGGLWSFESGPMQRVSNQYAAMPSLHIGWALWCSVVFWPIAGRTLVRVLVVGYPLITLFAIIVTGNHWWIDGMGGLLVLMIGYRLALVQARTGVIDAALSAVRRRTGRLQRTDVVAEVRGASAGPVQKIE
jgi:hypothetical protein